MTITEKTTQTSNSWPSRIGSWTRKSVVGGIGSVCSYIGQEAGRGYAVRIGTQWIYDKVHAATMEESGWFIGRATAYLAANSSAGIAVPYLSLFGSIIGGSIGFAVGTFAADTALKVGNFVMTAALSSVLPVQPSELQLGVPSLGNDVVNMAKKQIKKELKGEEYHQQLTQEAIQEYTGTNLPAEESKQAHVELPRIDSSQLRSSTPHPTLRRRRLRARSAEPSANRSDTPRPVSTKPHLPLAKLKTD